MKYVKWVVYAVAGIIFGLILIFKASNAVDDRLDPDAEAVLKEQIPVTEQGTKAFYYLLGLRAGDEKNPEATGRDLWNRGEAVPEKEEAVFFKDKFKDRWTSLPFSQHRNESDREQWKRKEVQDAFAKVGPQVQQYIKLLEYGEIAPLHTRDLYTAAQIPPTMLLKGSKWMHVYLGKLVTEKKWSEAERLVRLEANFQRSFWQYQPMLHMMVGTVIVQSDARFLNDEKKLEPKLKVTPQTVAALKMPETKVLFHDALKSEFRHFAAAMPMILNHAADDWLPEGSPEILRRMSMRRALLPNETINKYYQFTKEADEKICDDCYPSIQWAHPKYPWQWLRNPMGHWMMSIFTVQLQHRFEALQLKQKEIEDVRNRLSA